MKKSFTSIIFAAVLIALTGCTTVQNYDVQPEGQLTVHNHSGTISTASGNAVLTNRSQADAVGDQEQLIEGGGKPDLKPNVVVE